MSDWLVDGEPGDRISVMDRGLTYGDGLFETIAVRGGAPRFLQLHLERLAEGGQRLSIPMPVAGVLEREVGALASGCECGVVKIILTRGEGARGYAPPARPAPTRIVGVIPGQSPSREAYLQGIVARFCETPISVNPRLAGMKTLGRIEQVLGRAEWTDQACSEGIMATEDGRMICGTMTNLFLVADGRLLTPDLSGCGIRGVMRRIVIRQAQRRSIGCCETDVSRKELLAANEVFMTNSSVGIWPVAAIGTQRFEIGPVTRSLMAAVADEGVIECRQ